MKILLKHILRNIRQYKFRSILIIFSLAVSTMVMFLNLTIKDDITKKYTSVLLGVHQSYDLLVGSDYFNDQGYFDTELLKLDMVEPDHILYSLNAYAFYDEQGVSSEVILRGYDRHLLLDTQLCELEVKSPDFDLQDPRQVIISRKNADKFGWSLGDSVRVYTRLGEEQLTITGIAKSSGHFLAEYDNVYMITNLDYAEMFSGQEGKVQRVLLDFPDDTELEEVAEKITAANEHFNAGILGDKETIRSSLTRINQLLNIILSMVIGLNLYIIASLTKLMMATRIPVVGTFRSIGATKGKVNFILILENAVFGLIGSAFGIGFGILARKPMSGLFINAGDAFDYMNVSLEYKASYFLYSILFSMGMQIFISLSSILKASRRSIKDNIFNTLSTMPRISKKKILLGIAMLLLSFVLNYINKKYAFVLALISLVLAMVGAVYLTPLITRLVAKPLSVLAGRLFGGPVGLGMKSISASKPIRSSITLITVSLSLVIMVNAAIHSFNEMFDSFDKFTDYDVSVYWLSEEEGEYLYLEELEGIEHIEFRYSTYRNAQINGEKLSYILLGTEEFYSGIKGEQEQLAHLSGNEILIDEYFARIHEYQLGDQLRLELDLLEEGERSYVVAGYIDATYYTNQRNLMVINKDEYQSIYGKVPSLIEVYCNRDADEVKNMLMKELAGTGAYIETLKEDLAQQKSSNQSVINMAAGILALSVLLAICGLLNNQMIGFIQRKREYAVLYSISMSRAQLKRMIFAEALGTFLAGGAYATVISIWLIRLLNKVLMSIGMGYPIGLELDKLLQVLGVVLLLILVTSLSPMRKISKLRVIEEIKYE